MVKFIGFLKRKPGMTPEEFRRYWKEEHGPLVKGLPEFFRYVRRYVQSHPLENQGAGFSGIIAPFDGFAELWFDSLEDVGRAFAEPRYLEIIQPDEPKFLDLRNCRFAVVEEVSMHEG